MAKELSYSNIDQYIEQCDSEIRERLSLLRAAIREAAPDATEKISWAMPTFYQGGNLVHFAAGKHHIGIYPGAAAVEHFALRFEADELKYSKGAVQLPNSRPLPLDLVREIVRFCVASRGAPAAESV